MTNDFTDRVLKYFTDHPKQTRSPQSYCKHGGFAIYNSSMLIIAGFAGIIHGIFPFFFPFYTSGIVVRSFQKLLKSGRHDNEILIHFKDLINKDGKTHSIIVKPDHQSPNNVDDIQKLQFTLKIETV